MTRTFNAEKQRVFDAFASAEALAAWWGPVEAPIDVISLDFRPGGHFHYKMKGAQINYGIFKYVRIEAPDHISWINSFADAEGNITKPPFEGLDIPREIKNTITLTEHAGVTTLELLSEPVHASAAENETFEAIKGSMEKGFGGTLDQLAAYVG